MKQEPLNYQAVIYSKNWCRTSFDFHAESVEFASEHANHVLKASEVSYFDDWENGVPDEIKCIRWKFKGNQRWNEIIKKN